MERQEAIEYIEMLFPADCEYPDTAAIGQKLLQQAKEETAGWRTEPTEVLVRYAELCIQKENAQANAILRKSRFEAL